MTWVLDNSGIQPCTLGTEHILDQPTTVATYLYEINTLNMANGDRIEARVYDVVSGTATAIAQMWKGTFSNVQINNVKQSPPMGALTQAQFTVKQTQGVFPISTVSGGSIAPGQLAYGSTSNAMAYIYTFAGGSVALSAQTVILSWVSGTFTNGENILILNQTGRFVLVNTLGRSIPWNVRRQ
jgi:hypothetical protein